MTDNKPLITYAGEVSVFERVVPSLQKGIGVEAVEWKRAYGRSTKHVHLHPRFVPFDFPDPPLSTELLNSLLDQPMLHTFWTDCSDVEVYRSTTKDTIQSWLTQVKLANIKEWLIILVEPPDNKKTNKLLPRSSVLDKIKNDFAQKQTERCVGLSDPQKIDSKSAESLHAMLHRIRQLLLASYSKTLTKFEENMRAQREKRTEIGWNFCHYFLLQEELAFVLEMLEVYDEALVQYDELDALFTQFVLNSHLTDTPKWLLSFQRYGDRWPALTLCNQSGTLKILEKVRETIRNSSVSLLNFRNYLFARQAILLVKQRRLNELAQRSLAFLHNCINELSILDVAFSEEGSVSCWVFVSCLEILQTISNHNQLSTPNLLSEEEVAPKSPTDEDLTDKQKSRLQHIHPSATLDFSVHTASLWDYAREKLYELGALCGLLPKSQLKSDHLHKVITLSAGLTSFDFSNGNGIAESKEGEEDLRGQGESPIERLKSALSSRDKFHQNYLELCELAMGTYKHIGRLRSARKVGLHLASYYMEGEEWAKATVFLTEALHTFKDDGWGLLVVDVLLKLAQCYNAIKDTDRYIRTCAQIACSKEVSGDQRNHFFDDMMTALTSMDRGEFILSPAEGTFLISSVRVESGGKISGISCDMEVHLELFSNLPRPVLSNFVQMAILPCDHTPKQIGYSTAGTFSQGNIALGGKGKGKRGSGDNLKRKDSSESNSSSGAIEEKEKERLGRKESVTPLITCEDEDLALALMELNPAVMTVDLRQQMESSGSGPGKESGTKEKFVSGKLTCHNPHPSLRRKDSTQVKGEGAVYKTDFGEAATTQEVVIAPGANRIILRAKVGRAGNFRLAQVSIGVKHFELLSPRLGCRYRFSVTREAPTITLQNTSLVAGIQQKVTIQLDTGSYSIQEGMILPVRSSHGLKLRLVGEESEFCSELSLPLVSTQPFSVTTVDVVIKAELGPQKDSAAIEHRLIVTCPWTKEERKLGLVFVPPFVSTHKLHSTGQRKFLQLFLLGNSDTKFSLAEHQLTVQSNNAQDIPLVALNPRSQSLVLAGGKHAAYMWEVGVLELDEDQPLRLEFAVNFRAEGHEWEGYKYYVLLQRFKTQFELKSRVEPHKGTEFCRVGNMCSLLIDISRLPKAKLKEESQQTLNSLMYEVRADQHMWAICGRSSGVVGMEEESGQSVSLDVMPMCAGFLPLPTVHLSKYIPADPKSGTSNVPKLEPFNTGQVYNQFKGSQVHVLPPQTSLPQGLSGGGSGGNSLPITSDSHF